MDAKEEGIILGELKEFRNATLRRLDSIEDKVSNLDKFKLKVTLITGGILGIIELSFRVYEILK